MNLKGTRGWRGSLQMKADTLCSPETVHILSLSKRYSEMLLVDKHSFCFLCKTLAACVIIEQNINYRV